MALNRVTPPAGAPKKPASLFSGITEAQAQAGRALDVGSYLLEIAKVSCFMSPKDSMPVYLAEFSVVESDNPSFQVGDLVSWATKQGKFKQYFLAAVKSFLAAVSGVAQDEITEDDADETYSDDQPLKGVKVRAMVVEQPNKDESKPPYKNVTFVHYRG